MALGVSLVGHLGLAPERDLGDTGAYALPEGQFASWSGEASGDALGANASAPGDIDGDGDSEFLVGASGHDEGADDAGAVYVLPAY